VFAGNNIFVRDCCEKERAFRGRIITQLPAGSRLSVIELRKRRNRPLCVYAGWRKRDKADGIREAESRTISYIAWPQTIRYAPRRRRVFSSWYHRPCADNPISDIASIFNALEIHPLRDTLYVDRQISGSNCVRQSQFGKLVELDRATFSNWILRRRSRAPCYIYCAVSDIVLARVLLDFDWKLIFSINTKKKRTVLK